MKKFQLVSLVLVLGLVVSAFNNIETTTYNVDASASSLEWTGKKVTGEHKGSINIQDGALIFAGSKLKGGQFTIDMGSMTCTDLQGEWADKLVGHLKSDDFFGVANHATAQLVIKKAKLQSDNNYEIKADLTIKGTTEEVTFNATVLEENGKATANAEIIVDRTKYGIKYGSGSFFDGLGDKMIEDNFTLDVKIVAQVSM